jgi:hypothetical protein
MSVRLVVALTVDNENRTEKLRLNDNTNDTADKHPRSWDYLRNMGRIMVVVRLEQSFTTEAIAVRASLREKFTFSYWDLLITPPKQTLFSGQPPRSQKNATEICTSAKRERKCRNAHLSEISIARRRNKA